MRKIEKFLINQNSSSLTLNAFTRLVFRLKNIVSQIFGAEQKPSLFYQKLLVFNLKIHIRVFVKK
ncbi:hypothetical protein LCGC14_1686050 [marine sediment metagenome]|uniref:Uncharacterized protein n=1 Tax=marine sediment metagenome TaxID=412755 RepID=A0A0F9KM93_9ZZZZ